MASVKIERVKKTFRRNIGTSKGKSPPPAKLPPLVSAGPYAGGPKVMQKNSSGGDSVEATFVLPKFLLNKPVVSKDSNNSLNNSSVNSSFSARFSFTKKNSKPTQEESPEEEEEEEVEDPDIEEDLTEEENNLINLRAKKDINGQCSRSEGPANVDDLTKICTIGTGTFGRVLLMKHKKSGQHYALKVMTINDIIHMKQVEHVHSEKKLLMKLKHPFIVNLYWAYHDRRCLYMLTEFVPGGELFSYLRNAGRFSNRVSRFYAVEIISALEYMHGLSVVYRDLKPENLLLDREGHLRITDFGFAKELNDRTWTLCGTPEYLAPEVIESRGHNRAVDWWALGVLIYEMQAGYPPFCGDNALKIYEKILEGKVKFPKSFDLIAKDLVKKLLTSDRTKRLGNMKSGAEDVKNHKWFRSIDWNEVFDKKLEPPIVPKVYHQGDSGNFDEYDEEELTDISEAGPKDLKLFDDW